MSCEAAVVRTETGDFNSIVLKMGVKTESFLTDAAAAGVFVAGDLVSVDATTGVASHAAATPTDGERIAICIYGFDPRVSAIPSQTTVASFYTAGAFNIDMVTRAGVALSGAEKLAYQVAASAQGIELTTGGIA